MLIKYLQYLSFRKRLLEFIHSRKAGLEETDELAIDLTHLPKIAQAAEDGSVVRLGVVAASPGGFKRIPLGETVEIVLGSDDIFCFLLGRHRFELIGGSRPYVLDANGVTCFVRSGRNMVGRHPESDVTVDANFSDVSRAHLVLEWDGAERFRVMDLSSRGTWLPASFLDKIDSMTRPEDLIEAPL